MNRLNYFEPYISKGSWHEDQLTRAFLVTMRFVPLVQATFLDLIREAQVKANSQEVIPTLTALESECSIKSQVTSIEQDEGLLISVLMTDDHFTPENTIAASERCARYDGLVYFPPELILVIENKPWSGNVWEGQLHPNVSASSGVKISRTAAVVQWRHLIQRLNSLLERKLVYGSEGLMLEDFFEFVDQHFFFLNPYGSFVRCKGKKFLLERRCAAILESVAPDRVKRRKLGGPYIELTDGPAAGAYLDIDGGVSDTGEDAEWSVALSIYPGDTVNQARKFFDVVATDRFLGLQERGWKITPNLHFSFMSKNLYWSKGCRLSAATYLDHWSASRTEIRQFQRDSSNFQHLFRAMMEAGQISSIDFADLDEKFTNTERKSINICPGFRVRFSWSKAQVEASDSQGGRFAELVRSRISEALAAWGQTL